jgi:hypothetical protein
MEPPVADPVLDGVRREPELAELTVVGHTVLTLGQRRGPGVR